MLARLKGRGGAFFRIGKTFSLNQDERKFKLTQDNFKRTLFAPTLETTIESVELITLRSRVQCFANELFANAWPL